MVPPAAPLGTSEWPQHMLPVKDVRRIVFVCLSIRTVGSAARGSNHGERNEGITISTLPAEKHGSAWMRLTELKCLQMVPCWDAMRTLIYTSYQISV